MQTIAAAVIERDGRILICQRRAGDRFALLWEFPGGKVETGETLEAALCRELREELGVESSIGAEFHRVRHHYAGMQEELEVVFFRVKLSAPPRNLAFERMEWAWRSELPRYEFLPADRDLVARLSGGSADSS
jgi:8-oxo-dGTP diphosphatase